MKIIIMTLFMLAQTNNYEPGGGGHPPAGEPDPFIGLENPVTGTGCCAGSHCRLTPREFIFEGGDYYEYNGLRIPKNQQQPSINGNWYVCIHGSPETLHCILVPNNT